MNPDSQLPPKRAVLDAEISDGRRAVQQVVCDLRGGKVADDCVFDRFLPPALRAHSSRHWTPVFVVQRIVEWLESEGARRVVDLGSGAGKFCVAGALLGHGEFLGIEQRARLVGAARQLARTFGVDERVRFTQGVLGECVVPAADAYYLFNPFGENARPRRVCLDQDVELSKRRYVRDIRYIQTFLAHLPRGTLVIKYNGFGSSMPGGFEAIHVDRAMPCVLRMWRKAR